MHTLAQLSNRQFKGELNIENVFDIIQKFEFCNGVPYIGSFIAINTTEF